MTDKGQSKVASGAKAHILGPLKVAAEQAAEKVNSNRLLVAQAFLPVLVLLHLSSMHSQEWLCYSTFSAASEAATHKTSLGRITRTIYKREPGRRGNRLQA